MAKILYKFGQHREHYHNVMNPAHLDGVNEIYTRHTCTDVSAHSVDTLIFFC